MDQGETAKLYAQHGYFLFRRCLTWLGDMAMAQDAVRVVFVRALRSGDAARGESSPRTWLCRIADEQCLERLRLAAHEPSTARTSEVDPSLARCIDADDGESLLAVRHLIGQIEPEARRLAVLYYVDELNQEELARELGLSRSAVAKRVEALVAQARAALRAPEAV